MGDHQVTLPERRKRFERDIALALAEEALDGQAVVFRNAGRRLTTRAAWFTRGEQLAVIAGPYDDERDV